MAEATGTDLAGILLKAMPAFMLHPDAPGDEVVAAIEAQGIAPEVAEYVFEMFPLAVARQLLDGMGMDLAEEYIRLDASGTERLKRRLQDDPVFVAVAKLRMLFASQRQETILAIAGRSPEFQAVNQALHAGSDPKDLIGGPLVLQWREGLPEFPAASAPAKRPWWKFWG